MPNSNASHSPIITGKRKESPNTTINETNSSQSGSPSKKARVAGPTLPPAPLDERPPSPSGSRKQDDEGSSSTSSSDADFGPAPPTHSSVTPSKLVQPSEADKYTSDERVQDKASGRVERDAWMTMPPTQDDLSSRLDPTKLRARKFNTGRGAAAVAGSSSGKDAASVWTETPEQKRKRLADEVMGVAGKGEDGNRRPAPGKHGRKSGERDDAEKRKTVKRIQEHTEKVRGPSLYKSHQTRSREDGKMEEEDDPSARPFDRKRMLVGAHRLVTFNGERC